MKRRWPRSLIVAGPPVLVALLAIVLFWPATIGGKVLSASDIPLFSAPYPPQPPGSRPANPLQYDAAYMFEPDGLLVRSALRAGRLPVWTGTLSNGRPLLASQESAPLFPLTWIGVVLPYWSSLAWIAVLRLLIAGCGMYLLARALALRRGPSLLGAITFAFGTYLIVWLMHPHVNAYVLLPWLFLTGDRVCLNGTVRDAALLALVLGLAWLGGQPEAALIVSLAAAAWIAYRLLALGLPRAELLRRAALAVGAAVLGAGIAAVMLLPLNQVLGQSVNSSRSNPPLPGSSILSIFFPEYWGRPDRAGWPNGGPVNFTERTLYLGALPFLLAFAGLFARRPRGPQLFFAAMGAISLVVVFRNPIATLVGKLPLLDQINLNRVLILASFAIAMLAAFGCERLLAADSAQRRRMLIAAACAALLPVLIVIVAHPKRIGDAGQALEVAIGTTGARNGDGVVTGSVLRWLVFAGAGIAVIALVPRARQRTTVLLGAAVALVALDLLAIGWGYNPAIAQAKADPPTPTAVQVMRRLTAGGGAASGIDSMTPNTTARWDLRDIHAYEDPWIKRRVALAGVFGSPDDRGVVSLAPGDPRTPKALDVYGVGAVLLPRVPPSLAAPLNRAPVAYAGPDGVVLRNPDALPLGFVAYRWRPSPSMVGSVLLLAAGSARQALQEPVIETRQPSPTGPAQPSTPAHLVSQSDTAMAFDVDAGAPGQFVFLNTYYPGWQATVDGRSVPIAPANVAFDAVPIPAGAHRVRFSYHPTSVVVGGVISIVALVVTVLCLLPLSFLRRRRPSRG